MKRKISHLSLLLAFAAVLPIGLQAQELNESLTVEGEYTPEINLQERINELPAKVESQVDSPDLNYSSSGVPTDFGNQIFAMPVTGWRSTREVNKQRGYVDFGMGSYLNIVGSAGYRVIDSDKTKAGIWLQHNSSTGFVVDEYDWTGYSPMEYMPDKIKKYRLDSRIGLYGSHDFGVGRLSADLSYHYGRFNYYSTFPCYKNLVWNAKEPIMQNLNEVVFNADWRGENEVAKLDYRLDIGYHHFGYQHFYNLSAGPSKAQKENHFMLGGNLFKRLERGSAIGLDIDADLLVYSDPEYLVNYHRRKDYGMLSFAPYYRFSLQDLNVNVGVKADLSFNARTEYSGIVEKYRFVHLAPQVKADWRRDWLGVYAHILGGSELNTLAANSLLDYYQNPQSPSTLPMYSPLDLRLGVNVGRFAGFSAELLFDYKILDNVAFGGLYMNFEKPYYEKNIIAFTNPTVADMDIKGWRAGLKLSYQWADLLELNGMGYYALQDGEKGYFNGYDRPRWVVDANATVKPWSTLKVTLGYQYRGVRNLYDYTLSRLNGKHEPQMTVHANRLPDIALLNLGASYRLLGDSLTVWVQANNLLSSPTALSPVMPEEGFNFLIGAGYNF